MVEDGEGDHKTIADTNRNPVARGAEVLGGLNFFRVEKVRVQG